MSEAIARAGCFESESSRNVRGENQRKVGSRRMLFGTDHPFFPPLEETEKWLSVVENLDAIENVWGWGEDEKDAVRGRNAIELFRL